MQTVPALPLYRITAGVQVEEDFLLAFSIADWNSVPLDLSAVTFTAYFKRPDAYFSLLGKVYGFTHDRVMFFVTAANKAAMMPGFYVLSIHATAGIFSHEILGGSTLEVGAPRSIISDPYPTDELNMPTLTVLDPGVIISTPQEIALQLASLSSAELLPVINAMMRAVPDLTVVGTTIPAAGFPLVDSSGFYTKVQP